MTSCTNHTGRDQLVGHALCGNVCQFDYLTRVEEHDEAAEDRTLTNSPADDR